MNGRGSPAPPRGNNNDVFRFTANAGITRVTSNRAQSESSSEGGVPVGGASDINLTHPRWQDQLDAQMAARNQRVLRPSNPPSTDINDTHPRFMDERREKLKPHKRGHKKKEADRKDLRSKSPPFERKEHPDGTYLINIHKHSFHGTVDKPMDPRLQWEEDRLIQQMRGGTTPSQLMMKGKFCGCDRPWLSEEQPEPPLLTDEDCPFDQ